MNEFLIINVMNEAMIKTLEGMNKDCSENLKIKELLKDKEIFNKIDKSDAFDILLKAGVQEDMLENVYRKLIIKI